ncbi:FxsA family protein [Pseudoalteromonas spongiae]|uniref:FxsA family protein n=1 Tax=Pseudoalteromonas spongiae TaxID=298657 RepID=UPI00110B3BC7|nr:FxsA family protein [Pseudoalteromonas spongiae]TMO86047.1 F exclusion suppressor [Pseudoalteromonas spongiae]
MFKALFFLFIVIPIVEIALLIQVSEVIGGWSTIALVIVTAFVGAKLVKQQGTDALKNVQVQMAQGQMPAEELFAGLCVIIAGVLLLTPGIMTDVIGFLLLTPVVRKRLAANLMSQAKVKMTNPQQGSGFYYSSYTHTQSPEHEQFTETHIQSNKPSNTLEGEFERKD